MLQFFSATLLGVVVFAQNNPIIQIDIYRATTKDMLSQYSISNNDVADLGGVLKYIQTEAIVESEIGDKTRTTRKYGINIIGKWRFKIKNTPSTLADDNKQFTDFGPFVTFDYGQSTNPALEDTFKTCGDFVGLQPQMDPRWPSHVPIYWFSLSGFCPNLPFKANAPTALCLEGCPAKGDLDDPSEECWRYSDSGDYMKGGLCDGGENQDLDPTGEEGCVYSYQEPTQISLDDLVGILDEECSGGSLCTGFEDFRYNCKNSEYRQTFIRETGEIRTTDYCVEYDLHPSCASNCNAQACKDLIANGSTIELGLPFWRGRCDPMANLARMEKTAERGGIAGADILHMTTDPEIIEEGIPCIREDNGLGCNPDTIAGVNYCDRRYSGICTSCMIPGTKVTAAQQMHCPYDVLNNVDYAGRTEYRPHCMSKNASDLCCLYTNDCMGEDDPTTASLDDSGLQLVMKRQSTDDLKTFMMRYVRSAGFPGVTEDGASLSDMIYKEWGVAPRKTTVREVTERLVKVGVVLTTTTTTSIPTTATAITTTIGGVDDGDDSDGSVPEIDEMEVTGKKKKSHSPMPLILGMLVVCVVIGGVAFYLKTHQNPAVAMDGGETELTNQEA